jgi:ActR/RegA family two-component response regulator
MAQLDAPFVPFPATASSAAVSSTVRGHIVVVTTDDELGQIAARAAGSCACSAVHVRSGRAALNITRAAASALIIVDQALPDISGVDLARTLRHESMGARFALVGRSLATSITVEAMRLGAITVLDKPLALGDVVRTIRMAVSGGDPGPDRRPARGPAERLQPRSSAERWARHVLKGCEAVGDIKTLAAWALAAGVSYSSLCECCRVNGIQPLDARDLTRVLRAVTQSRSYGCDVIELLDIGDRRTLRALMARAGLEGGGRDVGVERFLGAQRFVPGTNAALLQLTALLRR